MPPKDSKKGLSNKFDVVAVYNLDSNTDLKPVDFISVLQSLRTGSRDAYFMRDMAGALDDSYPINDVRGPLRILEGRHSSGLRMTAVQATHEGVPTYLPIVEDTQTGKLLVVGPQGVAGAGSWKELTYVNAETHNKGMAIQKVNDFLADAAKYRRDKGTLGIGDVRDLVLDLIKATAIIADVKGAKAGTAIPERLTAGECIVDIAGGDTDISAYTIAGNKAKPPKSRR